MRGFRDLALIGLATTLRGLAHGPVWLAASLAAAADWLEARVDR